MTVLGPARASVFERVQIGLEGTQGTAVATNRRLPTMMMAISPKAEVKKYRAQGDKYPSIVVPNKVWSVINYDGACGYGELAWIFASIFSKQVPTSLGSGAYGWTFTHNVSLPDVKATYTIQQGDPSSGWQAAFGVLTDMTLAWNRDEAKVSGNGIGQLFQAGIQLSTLDATVTLTETGTPTGGTFTITIGGQTTTGIAYDATAATIKTAVELLSSVGTGNSVCAGGPINTTSVTIQLIGPAANQAITVNSSGLTGGTSPTIGTASSGGTGAARVENVPIIANQIDLFLDTTFAGIGTTKIPAGYSAELSLTGVVGADWVLDSSQPSWARIVELPPTASFKLTMEANSTSDAIVGYLSNATTVYLRMRATGPLIGGGINYKAQIDIPLVFEDNGGFKDQNGVWVADWQAQPIADATAGYAMNASLVNQSSAL